MTTATGTATELRNEARQALAAAIALRDEGKNDEFQVAFKDYLEKDKAADAADNQDAALKAALDKHQPAPSDIRNPADALIKTVKPEDATKGVMIQSDKGGFEVVQFADKDTEGWIKGYPPDCQHPSIVRRLTPELKAQAEFRTQAFFKWFRRGLKVLDAKEIKALQEGTDTEGGYLVPSDAVRLPYVHDPGAPGGVTRPISSNFNTTRDSGDWPTVGSVLWAAVAEEAALPSTTDPVFGQVAFTVRKIMGLTKVATELLEDSAADMAGIISMLYGESLGRYEDEQAIAGDGTTEPQGLRVAAVSDSVDSTAIATAPLAIDILKHYFALPAQFRANGTWNFTSSYLAKVAAISSASAGMRMVEFLGDPIRPVLLGRPIVLFDGTGWDDAAAVAANEEFGAFGDFRQYYFISRVGMAIKRLEELYAGNDQVGFVARVRYDSVVALCNAFRIIKAASA